MSAHPSTPLQRRDSRRQVMEAALRLSAALGHRKTTVADIARELAMSPANVYRFYRSKRAIDEAIAGDLLAEMLVNAIEAARAHGTATERLRGVLGAIERSHAGRLANAKLHDLLVVAGQEGWAVVAEHRQRLIRIVRWVIASGQMTGEIRGGDPTVLARCVLAAMEDHADPFTPADRGLARPTPEQMIDFCLAAVRAAPATPEQGSSQRMHALVH